MMKFLALIIGLDINYISIHEEPIETGYGLDDRGISVRVLIESRIFTSPRHPDRLWAHPTSYLMGTGVEAAGA
jgi:hypothetical protein